MATRMQPCRRGDARHALHHLLSALARRLGGPCRLAALQPDEADWVAEWASAGSPKLAVGQPLDWTTLPEIGTVVLTLAD